MNSQPVGTSALADECKVSTKVDNPIGCEFIRPPKRENLHAMHVGDALHLA